jgi:hypothetical protein
MKKVTLVAALILAMLTVVAPAHATLTPKDYAALHAGEPRWKVRHDLGTRGCRLETAMHGVNIWTLRAYKANVGDLWVDITYIKTPGQPFRLAVMGISNSGPFCA